MERQFATVVLSTVLAVDKLLDVEPFATESSLVPWAVVESIVLLVG